MFDTFNVVTPQLEARAILMVELKELQTQLARAKKKVDKGDLKKGRQYWALEAQRVTDEIRVLMDQIGPKLVK